MPADSVPSGREQPEGEPFRGRRRLLYRLYARLDRELAGLGAVCAGCGACCRFDVADHILYAGALEREAFVAALPSARPDASPGLVAAGLRCPFQRNGLCLAREARVLGCRLHFCSLERDGAFAAVSEKWHARLKRLHACLGVAWEYRPLLPAFPPESGSPPAAGNSLTPHI